MPKIGQCPGESPPSALTRGGRGEGAGPTHSLLKNLDGRPDARLARTAVRRLHSRRILGGVWSLHLCPCRQVRGRLSPDARGDAADGSARTGTPRNACAKRSIVGSSCVPPPTLLFLFSQPHGEAPQRRVRHLRGPLQEPINAKVFGLQLLTCGRSMRRTTS
jgi:hypothetical protein